MWTRFPLKDQTIVLHAWDGVLRPAASSLFFQMSRWSSCPNSWVSAPSDHRTRLQTLRSLFSRLSVLSAHVLLWIIRLSDQFQQHLLKLLSCVSFLTAVMAVHPRAGYNGWTSGIWKLNRRMNQTWCLGWFLLKARLKIHPQVAIRSS